MEVNMKKINLLYAGTPIISIVLIILGLGLATTGQNAGVAAPLFIIGLVGLFGYLLGHKMIFKATQLKMKKQLETMEIDQVFYGKASIVAIDQTNDKIVLTFAYNPFKIYTLPLSSITRAYTKDYKSGSGIFEGTMQVAFLFEIDSQTVKINTLTAHRQKLRMDSEEVLTGISKADAMVEILTDHLVK